MAGEFESIPLWQQLAVFLGTAGAAAYGYWRANKDRLKRADGGRDDAATAEGDTNKLAALRRELDEARLREQFQEQRDWLDEKIKSEQHDLAAEIKELKEVVYDLRERMIVIETQLNK